VVLGKRKRVDKVKVRGDRKNFKKEEKER